MKKHIEVPVLQMSAIVEDTTKAQTKVQIIISTTQDEQIKPQMVDIVT